MLLFYLRFKYSNLTFPKTTSAEDIIIEKDMASAIISLLTITDRVSTPKSNNKAIKVRFLYTLYSQLESSLLGVSTGARIMISITEMIRGIHIDFIMHMGSAVFNVFNTIKKIRHVRIKHNR